MRSTIKDQAEAIETLVDYLGSGIFYTKSLIDLWVRTHPSLANIDLIKDAREWLKEAKEYRDNV